MKPVVQSPVRNHKSAGWGGRTGRPALTLVGLLMIGLPAGAHAKDSLAHMEKQVGSFQVSAAILPMSQEQVIAAWNTPREQSFQADVKDEIAVGSRLSAVVMFAGAGEENGKVRLHCKTTFVFPDEVQQMAFDGICFDAKLEGPNTDIYLAHNGTGMVAPAILAGKSVTVEQVVTDEVAKITITLRVSVNIVGDESGS